jgi:hypothetical protein
LPARGPEQTTVQASNNRPATAAAVPHSEPRSGYGRELFIGSLIAIAGVTEILRGVAHKPIAKAVRGASGGDWLIALAVTAEALRRLGARNAGG